MIWIPDEWHLTSLQKDYLKGTMWVVFAFGMASGAILSYLSWIVLR